MSSHSILITENLDNALRHIRSRAEEVIIWVDAICINQSDADQKERVRREGEAGRTANSNSVTCLDLLYAITSDCPLTVSLLLRL